MYDNCEWFVPEWASVLRDGMSTLARKEEVGRSRHPHGQREDCADEYVYRRRQPLDRYWWVVTQAISIIERKKVEALKFFHLRMKYENISWYMVVELRARINTGPVRASKLCGRVWPLPIPYRELFFFFQCVANAHRHSIDGFRTRVAYRWAARVGVYYFLLRCKISRRSFLISCEVLFC